MYGRSDLDYQADITFAGANFYILQYTGKYCDVSPYCDNYESVKVIPILHAVTDLKSPETGQTYILVMHELLWMGDTLDHSLVNP